MQKTDYGVDAPGVLKSFYAGGLACGVGYWILRDAGSMGLVVTRELFFYSAMALMMSGVLMTLYVRFGKFIHRDRMLRMIRWRGDERVLDVGTGRGLLLIGAAKRLTTGQAVGIDIWSQKDMSDNAEVHTRANAVREGVGERIELLSEDVRHLRFAGASFDVVLSNLCLHNIPEREGREEACREIARVLRPGGVALISDFMKTTEYVKTFQAAGLQVERSFPYWIDTFPPLRVVRAVKPS